jgi:hypothetical protein
LASIEDCTTEPGVVKFAFSDRKVETKVETISQTSAAAEDEHSLYRTEYESSSVTLQPLQEDDQQTIRTHQETDSQLRERSLKKYIDAINYEVFVSDEGAPLFTTCASLSPYLLAFLRASHISPVERVLSQSGLISDLAELKCQSQCSSRFFEMQRHSVACSIAYSTWMMNVIHFTKRLLGKSYNVLSLIHC